MQITAQVVDIVGQGIITAGLLFPFLKKWTSKLGPVVQKEAAPIAKVGNELIHSLEDLFKLPEFAGLKAEIAAKTHSAKLAELQAVASAALHAYEKGFDALSKNEQGTLISLIRSKVGFSDAEIVAAIKGAQKLADEFKASDAYKHTQDLEASLKALAEAPPAPAVEAPAAQAAAQ